VPGWINMLRKVLAWYLCLMLLAVPGSILTVRYDMLMLWANWVMIVTLVMALLAGAYLLVWLFSFRRYAYSYTWSTVALIVGVAAVQSITVLAAFLWLSNRVPA
jgi:hypothetical protein